RGGGGDILPLNLQTTRRKRERSSARLALAAACCLSVLCAVLAHQMLVERGALYGWARSLYRQMRKVGAEQAFAAQIPPERADKPLTIYEDGLGSGWQDWSWAQHDLADTKRALRGKRAISMTPEEYKGVYLHHSVLATAGYGTLQLFFYGQASINVAVVQPGGKFAPHVPLSNYLKEESNLPAGWRVAQVPLTDLGVSGPAGAISGVVFQAASKEAQPGIF